jgi:hypothetical protein
MSKRIGSLFNPVNKEPVDIYEGFSWPCFFFSSLWFAVKGMWLWAVASFLIISSTLGLALLVFPFFANGMHRKHLRRNGWLTEGQASCAATSKDQAHTDLGSGTLDTSSCGFASSAPLSHTNVSSEIGCAPDSGTTRPGLNTAPAENVTPDFSRLKSLVFAKLDVGISWKNEYDVLDPKDGVVLFQLREGEIGTLGKIARMGNFATATGFDIMFQHRDGRPFFRVKGGGIKGGGHVFSAVNSQMGKIKRSNIASMNFEVLDAQGSTKLKTKSKGFGVLTSSHEILKGETVIGMIKDIDEGDAKQLLGSAFERLNNARKYDYAYHLDLSASVGDLEKALLLGTVYCIAHTTGRM